MEMVARAGGDGPYGGAGGDGRGGAGDSRGGLKLNGSGAEDERRRWRRTAALDKAAAQLCSTKTKTKEL